MKCRLRDYQRHEIQHFSLAGIQVLSPPSLLPVLHGHDQSPRTLHSPTHPIGPAHCHSTADRHPCGGGGREGQEQEQGEGHSRTHLKEDSLILSPLHSPLEISPSALRYPLDQTQDREEDQGQSQEQSYGGPTGMDHAQALVSILLEALDQTGRAQTQERGEGDPVPLQDRRGEETRREVGREEEERRVGKRRMEQLGPALMAAALGEELRQIEEEEEREERKRLEDRGWLLEGEGDRAGGGSEEGGQQKEEEEEEEEEKGGEAGRWGGEEEKIAEGSRRGEEGRPSDPSLQRKARGYFQNIDLGLQDNEILPPLKGYKAYNTQLAQAGKKLHWEEEGARNTPPLGGNFMDDFENEAEEEAALSMVEEEEARARAEQQEVQRQQEEAERAREEEQRLADIASDMLLQYMGRQKQQGAPYLVARQKAGANAAEDKRSEEVVTDGDDLDQQMIDRLIEISSKLHLPADDVVQIISNVEEKKKKKKRKELTPLSNPVAPRYRPLVPPPLATGPMYHYTASSNPKKDPYYQPYKNKWNKDRAKAKAYKQDYWFKPHKQKDVWFKPQKKFLAFPSYPYYQKPYRAYYPVYFPYPKPQYYDNTPMGEELPHSPPPDYELRPTRRRHRAGGRARGGGRHGWRQQPLPQHLPSSPYISNYILPHPRTYQPLPKPLFPQGRGWRPPYYNPPGPGGLGIAGGRVGGDYEDDDGLVPQLDSQEELENFISKIYMKRRMY